MYLVKQAIIAVVLMIGAASLSSAQAQVQIPSNQPTTVIIDDHSISFTYDGERLFKGDINQRSTAIDVIRLTQRSDTALTQVVKLTSLNDSPIHITGTIQASDESFPCEVDRRPDELSIVRNSVGLSRSLLNRAVYDRKEDWVLSIDNGSSVKITPSAAHLKTEQYRIDIEGKEITFRFQPRYYQYHLGLSFYKPWMYQAWKPSVAGWCSWFAYKQAIDEGKVHAAADMIARKLKDFGFDYIQIDDGYQRTPLGPVSNWLNANYKFPDGLDSLASYITHAGLTPGIWTNVAFDDKKYVASHSDLFVTNRAGTPVSGRWVGYPMDGSNPNTLNTIIRPHYRGLRQMGWKYFKLDALRHLRYEGYNSHTSYFQRKGIDRTIAYRDVVKSVRSEIGDSSFLLACWGVRPELIGLIDACRIGTDGFYWAGLAQYNAFNNVVWRNDPDHIVLDSKYAYRDCMLTSMTGSLLMITDKPGYYDTAANLDAATAAVPVLFTRPGQLYNVDPSRSTNLARLATAVSGSGERTFDAGKTSTCDLFVTEFNKSYGNWMILGRVAEHEKYIPFKQLGLNPQKKYIIFDFWHKSVKGVFETGFNPGSIDSVFNCQLFCIREKLNHPQLIATNRHISCGAMEIDTLHWNDNNLSGISRLPTDYSYVIYLYEPDNANYQSFHCDGATFIGTSVAGNLRQIEMKTAGFGSVHWKISYR